MPIWVSSMELATAIFNITDQLPRKEDIGLTSQIRRACLSVSNNIAEAFGRYQQAEKIHFYLYARGSAFETKNMLIYGISVGYFKKEIVSEYLDKVDYIISSINKICKSMKK